MQHVKSGLIIMGDLPKKMQRFFSKEMVSLLGVTYPDGRIWLTWQKDLAYEVLTGQG